VNDDAIRLLADELTGYHDPRLDLRTLTGLHEQGMRRLTRLMGDIGDRYVGPDRHLVYFALRSVGVEAERAMRLRSSLDRFPEWTWRPILRARVDKIVGCLTEVHRSPAFRSLGAA
jgi:hypothetical protein